MALTFKIKVGLVFIMKRTLKMREAFVMFMKRTLKIKEAFMITLEATKKMREAFVKKDAFSLIQKEYKPITALLKKDL